MLNGNNRTYIKNKSQFIFPKNSICYSYYVLNIFWIETAKPYVNKSIYRTHKGKSLNGATCRKYKNPIAKFKWKQMRVCVHFYVNYVNLVFFVVVVIVVRYSLQKNDKFVNTHFYTVQTQRATCAYVVKVLLLSLSRLPLWQLDVIENYYYTVCVCVADNN